MIEQYKKKMSNKIQPRNVENVNKTNYLKLIKKLYASDKIILHSLMSPRLVLVLFLNPWVLHKCYWAVWGSDLYYYLLKKKNIQSKIYEFFRRIVIKNMGGIITHVKGDYELAKEWYGAEGDYYYCFMYLSNVYIDIELNETKSIDNKTYIQIGNSADPSNNHIEILEKLKIHKNKDIKIICPLSYGDKTYARKVIKYGKKVFGEKFQPITKFMNANEYNELLTNIDVAIFNHRRQQAMGNISTLLGLGKKVYIRENITTWLFCKDHNLKVYSANNQFEDLFEKMEKKDVYDNIKFVKKIFSKEKLISDWGKVFKGVTTQN